MSTSGFVHPTIRVCEQNRHTVFIHKLSTRFFPRYMKYNCPTAICNIAVMLVFRTQDFRISKLTKIYQTKDFTPKTDKNFSQNEITFQSHE